MTMRSYLLAALVAMAGCVGGIGGGPGDDNPPPPGDDQPPPSGQARAMYEQNVFPFVSTMCGAGCHLNGSATSTPWVGTSLTDAYSQVIGFNSVVGNFTAEGAPIYFKVKNEAHKGLSWTPTQESAMLAWLAQEVIEHDTTDPNDPPVEETPGQATARLISEWSGCLKITDFETLRVGEAFANQTSGEGPCKYCHRMGVNGFIANPDNDYTYQVLSSQKYFMLTYFRPNVTDLANAKMEPNMDIFYSVGLNEAPYTNHPSFNLDNNENGIAPPNQVLQQLYDLTAGYLAAGTCGPPIITQ
jgi:hypothetical protein